VKIKEKKRSRRTKRQRRRINNLKPMYIVIILSFA